jgi:hypothetical protein
MRKQLLCITILISYFFVPRLYAQNGDGLSILPYENNCRYGLIECNTGKIIVAPKFESIEFFGDNFFKTKYKKNDKYYYGILSNNGKTILSCKYDAISIISGGKLYNEDVPREMFFVTTNKGITQYYTLGGKNFKIKEKLNYMPVFCGGVSGHRQRLYPFSMDGKWGVLKDRCVLVDAWYDSIKIVYSANFTTSWIITTYNKGRKIMNENGEFINKPIYDNVELINDLFKVTKNNLTGIVDFSGKEIIPLVYNNLQIINTGSNYFFIVSKNNQTGVVDTANKVGLPFKNWSIENNSSLSGFVLTDNVTNKKGFYCYNGLSVPCSYDNIISIVYSRFVLVGQKNKCMFYYDMKNNQELRKKAKY